VPGSRLRRQARPQHLVLIVIPGVGIAGLAVLQARLLSRVVAGVFLDGRTLAGVEMLLAGLLAVIAARAALVWAGEVAATDLALQVKTELRERLCAHLFALGPAYAYGERTGELTTTAVEGIEALDAYFSQYLPQVALAALVPLTVLVFITPVDPLVGLILLLTAPLIPLLAILIGRAADALTKRRWELLGMLGAHFLDVVQGLATLKIFGRSRAQAHVIQQVSDRFRTATLEVLRVAFLSALVLEMIATISTAIVAVAVGLKLLYGRMPFEAALFILILTPEFYLPLRLLGARFHASTSGLSAARRLFEILDTPAPPSPEPVPGPQPGTPRVADLRFEAVSFAYADGRRALCDVSFAVPEGQTVALVGTSGGGKSTIAYLLLRFIEPTQGAILVGGAPLSSWPAADWRTRVAWVPQTPYLFHDTLEANIRLARPSASREEIRRAAQAAHLDVFVETLPHGYETVIGEHGARLSGGEAQRVALARAFLKNAALLILDEPTAHLDPALDHALQESVARLAAGRTTVIIAHRLHTVRRAHQIIVLKGGRVAEAGTHAALMERHGLYRRLVQVNTETGVMTPGRTS
jgi:thiol reductant ABC exporter CydD subunit